jgi:hypothetical protein
MLQSAHNRVISQLYEAPVSRSGIVRDSVNQHFLGQGSGKGGLKLWPPGSSDFTPLDFCLWDNVKQVA